MLLTLWLQFRAVITGLIIGLLLCFTNTYFGLQTGWISMMSLQASLLGYLVFKILPKRFTPPLTVKENILLQTTAVALGTLPLASGLVGVVPALAMLNEEEDGAAPITLSWAQLVLWCTATAFFGVFLAVPLRRQVIVKEKLVFPSGTATAQIIGVLHGKPVKTGTEGIRKRRASFLEAEEEEERAEETAEKKFDNGAWRKLVGSFLISAGYSIVTFMFPVLYAIPIFDFLAGGLPLAAKWSWWFTPSFSYVGQGIIMGFETTVAMNLGALVGWGILSPIAKNKGWAPGPVSSSSDGARGWILWPALAILLSESILSLSLVFASYLSSRLQKRRQTSTYHTVSYEQEVEEKADEPSLGVVAWGLGASFVVCVALVKVVFGEEGIAWWACFIALILACAFAILGVRALGETDLNPVSAVGKISQLLFAVIQPGNVVANLVAGGLSEAGAQQSGDLMQDLKTGHLHGASPRVQFYGQLIGSFASVFVSSTIFLIYSRTYTLPSAAFPVPTAGVWLNLARLVNTGSLPPATKEFMLVFGPVFLVTSLVKYFAKERYTWARFIPSGIAFSIGFINTPSFSMARLVGGYIAYRRSKKHVGKGPLEDIDLLVTASGFVLGEGFASIIGLILTSLGVKALSCWGCGLGGGGYCPGSC
ncbi:OPT superfamily oligopeptide transporter [Atractiella rhizophila]|nr:OPT superfamily oligopeptide transporter [Atractiella rhizophila]